jgi:hypothetical protein
VNANSHPGQVIIAGAGPTSLMLEAELQLADVPTISAGRLR